jgi:hypothetical protein
MAHRIFAIQSFSGVQGEQQKPVAKLKNLMPTWAKSLVKTAWGTAMVESGTVFNY